MPISPGDNVGPYRIIEPLGQGGMATVFKAYHPALDRYIAIKVLHPSFKEDPNFNARFVREARIVAKLDHPNIVPIYDFAEQEGTPYLVMRFIEGKTLKAVMRDGLLPVPRVLAIIHPVTEALAYAHAQGILHRDIKPSNIMRANDGRIYLTDFGLARIAQAGDSTMSQDMLIGTPQYISPEQARGEPASERSDIYSLGVVLFEMFVGRVPYSADTPYAIIHDHIYTALPLPTSLNPTLSKEIERVLLKILAKEPEARYPNATEVMTALEQAAGIDAAHVATMSPPPTPISQVVAPPPTVPEPVAPVSPPPVKSTPKLVAQPAPEQAAAVAAPKPKRGVSRLTCAIVAVLVFLLLVCGLVLAINSQSPLRQMLKNLPPPAQTADPVRSARDKVNANPQDALARVQLGDELARQKDFDAAYAEYERALRLSPRLGAAYLHAGDAAQKQGDLIRASQYYDGGLTALPGNTDLLLRQADVLFQLKRPEDAQMLYEKVLRADPNDPMANFGMGRIAKQRGDAEEAKRRFSFVIANKDAPASLIEDAKKQLADLTANSVADNTVATRVAAGLTAVVPTTVPTIPGATRLSPTTTLTPVPTVPGATRLSPTTTLTPMPTMPPRSPQKRLVQKSDGGSNTIDVVDLATKAAFVVYGEARVISAAWSPDGSQVLISSSAPPRLRDTLRHVIRTVNADGSNLKELVQVDCQSNQQFCNSWGPNEAIWSPDGKRILVRELVDLNGLFLRNPINGQPMETLLSSPPVMVRSLATDIPRFWSVDGNWVIAVSTEPGHTVFAVEVNGNRRVPVSSLGGIKVYDQRFYPWKVMDAPARCPSHEYFSECP